MKAKYSTICLLFLSALQFVPSCLQAQDSARIAGQRIDALGLELRTDFGYQPGFDSLPNTGGFSAKVLNVVARGQISDRFSYVFRHRLNSANHGNLLKSTDYAYVTCRLNDRFSLTAGKQVVYIGGYEYDLAPIDAYMWSVFWDNVGCYSLGATLGYDSPDGRHSFLAQFCNSPFANSVRDNMYAYNLAWYGNMGVFSTIYSINLIEYEKSKYVNYFALGNKLEIDRKYLYIDYMKRASGADSYGKHDFSLIGGLGAWVGERWKLFACGGYDLNKAQDASTPVVLAWDRYVAPGTESSFAGVGAEFFPQTSLGKVRAHIYAHYRHDPANHFEAGCGLAWWPDFLARDKRKAE